MSRIVLAVGILVLGLGLLYPEIFRQAAESSIKGAMPVSRGKEEPVHLELILKKVAGYCQRLERVSLHFVCNEGINEQIRSSWQSSHVYDYQLIRKAGHIEERRILLEVNGESKHEENAELKTQRFRHKYVIFGPIGLFSVSQQRNHDYAVKKEEKFKEDSCLVIEAVPKANVQVEHLFGRAWVRKKDFSIMKIEWNQESMKNIEKVEKEAKKIGAKSSLTFISEYAYEKNGIRFPSKYFVKEEYLLPGTGRIKMSETTVVYKDYRFFLVETEVKIKQDDGS